MTTAEIKDPYMLKPTLTPTPRLAKEIKNNERTLESMRRALCFKCQKRLPAYRWRNEAWALGRWGYQGNGYFCSLRCGYHYALGKVQDK